VTVPLLEVRHLTKHYSRPGGLLARATLVRAVADVSFSVAEGETFGLVGESGSGKTTTGRCVLRLVEPTGGSVLFRGQDLLALSAARMRAMRREMQMIFQDPYASLNPRMRIEDIVAEPLVVHRVGSPRERHERVAELLRTVGLDPDDGRRLPREFSGGERQRIGIARALALGPSFVVADEPVASLDVSIQAQIVNLLMDLQERLRLTCLFIAHDLRLVRHVCERVAVMYRGRIVETGPTAAVYSSPRHAYTQALLLAAPTPDPSVAMRPVPAPPGGFDTSAPLREVSPGHLARC
jgi:ABC-type oligopeptide transport system ATPase subunit